MGGSEDTVGNADVVSEGKVEVDVLVLLTELVLEKFVAIVEMLLIEGLVTESNNEEVTERSVVYIVERVDEAVRSDMTPVVRDTVRGVASNGSADSLSTCRTSSSAFSIYKILALAYRKDYDRAR